MKRREQQAYQTELRRVAGQLGLPSRGDLEDAIIRHSIHRIEGWTAEYGRPSSLAGLLEQVATCLGMQVFEIASDENLQALLQEIPPGREPIVARLATELDDQTDGIMIQRQQPDPWERPFVAVINCRGWHGFRRYFSKWHEAAHLLIEGPQLRFAFRKTQVSELRRQPIEILVDRVAGELAFYAPIFRPVLLGFLEDTGRLSFDMMDQIRQKAAPEASRQATMLACVRQCPDPVYFVRCQMGYKREEQSFIESGQMGLFSDINTMPEPRLRVAEASSSQSAVETGIRIHHNMRVPLDSVVARSYFDPLQLDNRGIEPVAEWKTSDGGPIGDGRFEVEAIRVDDEVWALIQLAP